MSLNPLPRLLQFKGDSLLVDAWCLLSWKYFWNVRWDQNLLVTLLHVYVHIPHFGKGPRFWHTVHLFRRCPRLLRCTSQSLPLVMNAISAHMLLHAALDIKRHQRSYCKGLMGFYMFPCDQESHGRIQIPDIVSIGKEIYWCLIIETPCPTNSRLWYKKEYSKYMTGLLWWLSSCG